MNKIDKIMHRLIKGQNPAIIKIALSRKPSTERSVAIGLMAIQHKNLDKNVSSQATAETSTNDTIPPGDQDIEEDGGPGSGNWGHKGRPGQVGGSGKGGGKQYRGGRGDITYISSKHDWLNGLTGEKQHEAQSFMKRMKQAFPLGEEKNRSTEENILRETEPGILKTKKQLTDYMAEARSWDEKAGKLIDENLDDTDKKYIETLANKYGMTFSGGVMLPDESDIGDWDEDDQHFWYDLKSKAMGGPTSGRDAPDELQYEAGIKERPKPTIPTNSQENDEWFDGLPNDQQTNIRQLLSGVGISMGGFYGIDVDMAERQLLNGVMSERRNTTNTAKLYFKIKDDSLGGSYFKNMQAVAEKTDSGKPMGNLSESASAELSALMSDWVDEFKKKPGYENITISSYGDILESDFLNDKHVDSAVKRAYMSLKAVSLGYDINSYGQASHVKTLAGYRKNQAEAKKQAAETKEKQKVFREEAQTRSQKYSAAKSTSEIADILTSSGVFKGDHKAMLSKTDPEAARAIAQSYEMVGERFPFIVGALTGLDENESGSGTYACCYTLAGGRVSINASSMFFGDIASLQKSYDEDLAMKYHPAGTDYRSVVTHELGHAVDGYLTLKGVMGAKAFSTEAKGFSGLLRNKTLKALKMTKSMIGNELSIYAERNAREWFAECFAEAMHSENPRPMAREMMRQLEDIIQKEGLNNV